LRRARPNWTRSLCAKYEYLSISSAAAIGPHIDFHGGILNAGEPIAVATPSGIVRMPTARFVTAAILATSLISSIIFLPASSTSVLFMLFVFVAALEWGRLAGLNAVGVRFAYALTILIIVIGAWRLSAAAEVLHAVLVVGCLWWFIAMLWVIAFQLSGRPAVSNSVVLGALGVVVFVPVMCALAHLLTHSPGYLLGMFAVVWGADIFAYFGGRKFGRARLASRVSPGKTWAGLVSAVVGTVTLGIVVNETLLHRPHAAVLVIVFATLLAAVVGDLFESLLKRLRDVKDSGSLLPGHGGVLDRIDSLIAAAPVFTFTLHIVGYS
jgi:phosphatidate cytidylyltransferase